MRVKKQYQEWYQMLISSLLDLFEDDEGWVFEDA